MMQKCEQVTQRTVDKAWSALSSVFTSRLYCFYLASCPSLHGGSVYLRVLVYGGTVEVGQLSLCQRQRSLSDQVSG